MSMSAHVTTMRRQDRQDDTTEELPENFQKLIIRPRVHTQQRLTATLSPTKKKAVSFLITQFDVQALFFPSFNVFLHCCLEKRLEDHTAQKAALFCSTSDPEFITFLVSQYGGTLICFLFFRKQMCFSLTK